MVTLKPDLFSGEYFVLLVDAKRSAVLSRMPTWSDAYSHAVMFARIHRTTVDRAVTGARACALPRSPAQLNEDRLIDAIDGQGWRL